MLKNHPKLQKFLIWLLVVVISYPVYLFLKGQMYGFSPENYLPAKEEIVQAEVWASDAEKVYPSKLYPTNREAYEPWLFVRGFCYYRLWPNVAEDIPRVTVLFTLEDGSLYKVVVGDKTVSFNGTFRKLCPENAAEVLTEALTK